MLFVVFFGEPSDPLRQHMRLIEAENFDEARQTPGCIAAQIYEEPRLQEPIDEKRLRRGMTVWAS